MLFWIIYSIIVFIIMISALFFSYITYNISKENAKFKVSKIILKALLIFISWVFLNPFMDFLLSIFKCNDGKFEFDESMLCYSPIHIVLMILNIICMILLITSMILGNLFYKNTQPVLNDTLARIDDYGDMIFILYRFGISICEPLKLLRTTIRYHQRHTLSSDN